MNRTGVQTPPELHIPASGPIIPTTELERAERSLKKLNWTSEQIEARFEAAAAKRSKYVKEKPFNIPRRKGGKGA